MGQRNNQNGVQIPHGHLRNQLETLCEHYGIHYVEQEERYPSNASFLDGGAILLWNGTHQTVLFRGKRIKRGSYRTKDALILNADVNGAANILRKSNHRFDCERRALAVGSVKLRSMKRERETMISIPRQLTEDALVDGLMAGEQWISRLIHERQSDVSFHDLEWVEPGGVAPLAALATMSRWHTLAPSSAVYSYLQRMKFADMFGFTKRLEFVEHDPDGRFIPAVWVPGHDRIEPLVNDIKSILRRSRLEQGVQWATTWSLNELIGNVIVHARTLKGGLVFGQVFPSKDIVQIAVCDTGIGFSGSIQESHPTWNGPDTEALELGLQKGWSSKKGTDGAGNGLYLVNMIVSHSGLHARLVVISGKAIAVIRPGSIEITEIPLSWPGTTINCTLDLRKKLDMEEILGHPDDLDDDDLWEVEDE